MTMRGSFATALMLVCIFGLATFAPAQPDQGLKQAVDLFERGDDAGALAKLKEVVASDPSSEDAFNLLNAVEMRLWSKMMIKSGEHATVIRQLFHMAMPAQRDHAKDSDTIRGLVKGALDGSDWAKRQAAMVKLAADHGEYAVPHLLDRLKSEDSMRRAAAMELCRRLGTQSVMPLVQALEIDDDNVRAGALTVLGQVGDQRALPYVAAWALGPTEGRAREAGARALKDMGAGGTTAAEIGGLFQGLAESFYRRDTSVVDPFRRSYVAWAQADGALIAREVPRDVYHLKLAEEVLFDMVNWDPNQMAAQVLLGSVLVAQEVAANGAEGGAEGPEAPLSHAGELAASLGSEVMDGVVRKALADGRPAVAAGGVRILGSLVTADTFNTASAHALFEALSAPYKSVRFGAALAIARIGPRGAFPGQERVIGALQEALGQDAVRTVVVIDHDADSRNRVVADLNGRGYFAYGVDNGPEGLARVRDYPIEDLVIIRYDLADATVHQVLKTLNQDDRTKDTPVAILAEAGDMDAAKSNYGEGDVMAQAFIASPPVAGAYEPGLRALVKTVDSAREMATMVAARAASALAHMDPRGAGLSSAGAAAALAATLKGDDRVRIPAMNALGRIGDASAGAALLAVFGDGTASEDVRGHAALAMASIARIQGTAPADVVNAIQASMQGEGSAAYWGMLGRACGVLPVGLDVRTRLLNALRTRITVDTETDG